jgi:hypothetical protein
MRTLGVLLAVSAVAVMAHAEETQILPLSGMGAAGEKPVYWDFQLDSGRSSGRWTKIVVPSNWEQQGFGSYYYGTQGRGRPDSDPVIPKETATYRRSFVLPARWNDHAIVLVFEAAMTDTSVSINGKSAGATHQGGFYRFSYDVTALVKPGRNDIEVRVSKESADSSVNRAERRGDFWTFGGIFRPVWLEARPRTHIAWTAIDARADGSFYARATLNREPPEQAMLEVQLRDARGLALPGTFSSVVHGTEVAVRGNVEKPSTWSAETPTLYSARFTLSSAGHELHARTERFGFRTVEVRANDGVYLNGHKIVLKGVNRHSFDSLSGRTLTRAQNYADAQLIKGANMNAVRMSHYPPDPAFLEAADEIGLYVLDELAGWQGSYDAETGARLIGQMVRRDVNHPGILFWDNGNEGGWNVENDAEFARWDPQRRSVLHPWALHDAINTDHYENYDSTVQLSRGPEIFMPTEFLHGLYDGGIGAGLRDYWNVMGRSSTVAGGFFWAFADEGVTHSDTGKIDNVGNSAPDGMLGAHHEKEGSYFAVKELWSPVVLSNLALAQHTLSFHVENRFDFTDLARCSLRWRTLRLPAAGARDGPAPLVRGRAPLPALAARGETDVRIPIGPEALGAGEVLEVSIDDPDGRELWTWVLKSQSLARVAPIPVGSIHANGSVITAGAFTLEFDAHSGALTKLSAGGRSIPLAGPRLVAFERPEKSRGFTALGSEPALRKLTLAPTNEPDVIARAEYSGTLRDVTWRLRGDELAVRWHLDYTGAADILGVDFAFPEDQVLAKRWVGAGPYHVWKNRRAGTSFGFHAANYSRAIPGAVYAYPEFQGFFDDWSWYELRTRDARVIVRNMGVPYFGLYSPAGGEKPILELPPLGLSFLHAIPPIGTKFALPDVLGPESQPAKFDGGELTGEIAFSSAR